MTNLSELKKVLNQLKKIESNVEEQVIKDHLNDVIIELEDMRDVETMRYESALDKG